MTDPHPNPSVRVQQPHTPSLSTDADLPPPYYGYLEDLLRLGQDLSSRTNTLATTTSCRQVTSGILSPSDCPVTVPRAHTSSAQPDTPSAASKPKRAPSAAIRQRIRRAAMKHEQHSSQAEGTPADISLPSPTPHAAAATPSGPDRLALRDPRLAHIAGATSPIASQGPRASSQSPSPSDQPADRQPPLASSTGASPNSAASLSRLLGLAASTSAVSPYGPAPGQPGYVRRSPTSPLSPRPSGTPRAASPRSPRPIQPAPRAGEILSETTTSSSPSLPHKPSSQSKSSPPAQADKRPRSDDAVPQGSPTTAPYRRHYPTIAENLVDERTTPVPRSPNFPWVTDSGLIDLASKGLLMPLELIRLLPLSTIHDQGIPKSLWHATPAPTSSTEARDTRQRTFASAFADRDTLLEAWQNYMTIAIEVHHYPADRISGYFNHRWSQIERYARAFGWSQMLQLLHYRLELSVAEGLRLDHPDWLDLDRTPRTDNSLASIGVSAANSQRRGA